MKGDVLLQNIKVTGIIPASAGKKSKESKLLIREAILTKLGKNVENVRKRCAEKPLSVTIVFSLHTTTHAKKDLSGLSDNIIKILGEEMSSKKDALKGLEIVNNTNLIHRIILEKNIVKKDVKEEFSLSIYEWD
ncbi:MAG: hypothetical protein K8Q89_08040 [Nitrosarchaeum sp.]|nr:hypothetical protein [Nitrosarchaeum sp.]